MLIAFHIMFKHFSSDYIDRSLNLSLSQADTIIVLIIQQEPPQQHHHHHHCPSHIHQRAHFLFRQTDSSHSLHRAHYYMVQQQRRRLVLFLILHLIHSIVLFICSTPGSLHSRSSYSFNINTNYNYNIIFTLNSLDSFARAHHDRTTPNTSKY